MGLENEGQQAVVGGDEEEGSGRGHDRPPIGAHPGIDDRDEHGPRRVVGIGGVEGERPRPHVVGRDLVEHVHERRLGADGENRALHGSDVGVVRPEVGEEGDDRRHQCRILAPPPRPGDVA
jgi:hypothetical protein